MVKLKEILEENDFEKKLFDELKGSYSLQGHVSDKKEIDLRNVSDFKVDTLLFNKPKNVFWTSTVFKDVNRFITKWINFGRLERDKGRYFHVFTVDKSADVLHVNTEDKVDEYLKFKNPNSPFTAKEFDWETVFHSFDGIHVFDGGLQSDYFEYWDIESTAWFRPEESLKKQFVWKIR